MKDAIQAGASKQMYSYENYFPGHSGFWLSLGAGHDTAISFNFDRNLAHQFLRVLEPDDHAL